MKVQMVLTGARIAKGKIHYEWTVLDEEMGLLTTESLMFSRMKQHSHLGGVVYEFERTDNGVKLPGRLIGEFEDRDKVVEWQTSVQAVETDHALKKASLKSLSQADLERLRPFAEAYANAVGRQRTLIVARVVAYITSGR